MKTVYNFIKRYSQLIISLIIVITLTLASVYAASTLYESNVVGYDNTTSGLTSGNVQDALDELYGRATEYTDMETRISSLENNNTIENITFTSNQSVVIDPNVYFWGGKIGNLCITSFALRVTPFTTAYQNYILGTLNVKASINFSSIYNPQLINPPGEIIINYNRLVANPRGKIFTDTSNDACWIRGQIVFICENL